MKSKSNVLFLFVTVFLNILIFAVPRLMTEGLPDHNSREPWLATWKNYYKFPYESFVAKNHSDGVCQADLPCSMPPAGTPNYIVRAVANWIRFPQDVWEDATTKPWQALEFIGVKPGDRVVDVISGNRITTMYWSRLFYHTVGDDGRVYPFIPSIGCRAAHVSACIPERNPNSSSKGYGIRPFYTIMGDPRWNGVDEALDMEHTFAFKNLYTELDVAGQFAIPEQADVVWSTGLWHQFHGDVFNLDMADFIPRVFAAINSGGSLVIADYAGNPGTGFTQVDTLHRVDKEALKAELTKYGFVFDSESTLWAKSDDDHTRRVPEQSPPGIADMFILKFKKPMNAPPIHRPTRQQIAGWLDANYSESATMEHGQRNGGGTWYNADYTATEFQGPSSGGMVDTWFLSATGEICIRQEYTALTAGIIGCHYGDDRLVLRRRVDGDTPRSITPADPDQLLKIASKLGIEWTEITDFDGRSRRTLSPFHTWVPRPADCSLPTLANPAADCRYYHEEDNLGLGHMR